MSFTFQWNPYADQPHNVAPKKERLWHHFKHAGSYVSLMASNLKKAAPTLALYRKYRKEMYKKPVKLDDCMALSVSPLGEKDGDVIECLKETGVNRTLVRIPSWEREKLDVYEKFSDLLLENGLEFSFALLQRRDDVLYPQDWVAFLRDVFSRFRTKSSFFEVGHAWNRTKWGVWDHQEYLRLVRSAVPLAKEYGVTLIGPAVIDFEFHLYPAILKKVPFDVVSSLLYVDRMGAPENTQFGWDTSRKVALLKAVVDASSEKRVPLWITEVNWPLEGTGKYSPAAGRPNVTEEEQANYLVRYFVLCLSSGYVERIYWWQLVAPGYGLIDSRDANWQRRPSFYAFKTLVKHLEGSTFVKRIPDPKAQIFQFRKGSENFAVCWIKKRGQATFSVLPFAENVVQIVNRNGEEIHFNSSKIQIDESPKYIFF